MIAALKKHERVRNMFLERMKKRRLHNQIVSKELEI